MPVAALPHPAANTTAPRDDRPNMDRWGVRLTGRDIRARQAAKKSDPEAETHLFPEEEPRAARPVGVDPNAETRRIVRARPDVRPLLGGRVRADVTDARAEARDAVIACLEGALGAGTDLAEAVRAKVAGQILKVVSAKTHTGYHVWDDGSPNGLDILYRVEGSPLKTDAKEGVPADNLGNGLVKLRDDTWKLVRSMLDFGL